MAWHHALLLKSGPSLFFQLLLNLVDFLCQEVIIFTLEYQTKSEDISAHMTLSKRVLLISNIIQALRHYVQVSHPSVS